MASRPLNPDNVCELCRTNPQSFQTVCHNLEKSHTANICSECRSRKVRCGCGWSLIDPLTILVVSGSPPPPPAPTGKPTSTGQSEQSSTQFFECTVYDDNTGFAIKCTNNTKNSKGPFVKDPVTGDIYCPAHCPDPKPTTMTSSKEKQKQPPIPDSDWESDVRYADDDDNDSKDKEKKPSKKKKTKSSSSSKSEKKEKKEKRKFFKSAYNFFCDQERPRIKLTNPDMEFGEVSRELGARWKRLDAEDVQPYSDMAAAEREKTEAEDGLSSSPTTKKSKKRKSPPSSKDKPEEKKPKKTTPSESTSLSSETPQTAPLTDEIDENDVRRKAYLIFHDDMRPLARTDNPSLEGADLQKAIRHQWSIAKPKDRDHYHNIARERLGDELNSKKKVSASYSSSNGDKHEKKIETKKPTKEKPGRVVITDETRMKNLANGSYALLTIQDSYGDSLRIILLPWDDFLENRQAIEGDEVNGEMLTKWDAAGYYFESNELNVPARISIRRIRSLSTD